MNDYSKGEDIVIIYEQTQCEVGPSEVRRVEEEDLENLKSLRPGCCHQPKNDEIYNSPEKQNGDASNIILGIPQIKRFKNMQQKSKRKIDLSRNKRGETQCEFGRSKVRGLAEKDVVSKFSFDGNVRGIIKKDLELFSKFSFEKMHEEEYLGKSDYYFKCVFCGPKICPIEVQRLEELEEDEESANTPRREEEEEEEETAKDARQKKGQKDKTQKGKKSMTKKFDDGTENIGLYIDTINMHIGDNHSIYYK